MFGLGGTVTVLVDTVKSAAENKMTVIILYVKDALNLHLQIQNYCYILAVALEEFEIVSEPMKFPTPILSALLTDMVLSMSVNWF